jgi:cysteine desulfurase
MRKVYLDHSAGTPLRPEALQAMLPFLQTEFGNPLSIHSFGDAPREALERARKQVADLIGANPNEMYFTASGSEANNMALKGAAWMNRKKGNHIVVSSIEHQSVLNAAATLEKQGFEVTRVPVDRLGRVDPDVVVKAMRPDTILVSVMHANNEIGTIEPLADIVRAVKSAGNVLFHTDAVASAGKIPVNVQELGVDLLSLAGSQFYGPTGAAALYMKKGTRIMPLIDGGVQENGRRAGTENLPGIVGFGVAAELARQEMATRTAKLLPIRDRLIDRLTRQIDHVILTGDPVNRLPHHASVCVQYVEGEAMLLFLASRGVAAASGSTCTSKALKSSHVLEAIGLEPAIAQGSLVFTLGEDNVPEDVDYVLEVFPPIVERLRAMSPIYPGSSPVAWSEGEAHHHEHSLED